MASKTKKKASKETTSKKAAARNAPNRAAKKGGAGGGVSHTPIIITDGSASIEFDELEYPAVSATTHQSTGLRLSGVSANKKHSNGSIVCHNLATGEKVSIVVTCVVGGTNPKTFTINGGNFVDGTGSPSIAFDHTVFDEVFTPIDPGNRVRRGKGNRDITKLEIFRVSGGGNTLVHDCDVIAKKNFRIKVRDPHVH